jgi:phosphomannomutase
MTLSKEMHDSIRTWISNDPDWDTRTEIHTLLEQSDLGEAPSSRELLERFAGRLAFGTSGIRGPVRGGPSGMNRVVVSQTTAGLASYLLELRAHNQKGNLRVVVGCDARTKSGVFQRDTLEVLSGHGIEAIAVPARCPTPVLAFAVRHLNADAGVMITASHNPPADNGYKVYLGGGDQGSQIIFPVDRRIEAHIQEVANTLSFSEIPRSKANVGVLDHRLVTEYITAALEALNLRPAPKPTVRTVYTAMHGVGGETFLSAMVNAGFPKPHVVEQQFDPDPDFPTVAFPNPEEKGALDLSFDKARSVGADLIIAHDPDADRLAVALPNSSTSAGYRALTGNQVGAIFGWHISQKVRSSGGTGTLANSLVSSPVLGRIAEHFGLDHEETLTGFKYVSRVKNLIFGFEEALGYLVTPDVVRDKDGISAGLLMVSIAHTLAEEGRTPWDYLHEIEESVGAFASGQVTIRLNPGVAGSTVTTSLRERELSSLGSRSVTLLNDFLKGVGTFPQEDILRYYLDDGTRVIARPSGTEPKVKVYIDTEGATSAEAQSRLAEVESDINKLINSL